MINYTQKKRRNLSPQICTNRYFYPINHLYYVYLYLLIIHHFLCSFSTSRCTVFLALVYRVRKLMIFGWSIYFLFTEPSNDVHIDRSSHAVACLGLLRDGVNLSGDAHTRFVARASRFHR